MIEQLHWDVDWKVIKYASEADRLADKPYAVEKFKGNLLLNEGINNLMKLIVASATAGAPWDGAHAYIGVGDSSTAAAATQTGLQASTNKAYVAVDANYPADPAAQSATWRATFDSDTANFAWNEFTVANGNSDAASNLNRKVQSCGTKVAGLSWVVEMTVTIS